MNLANFSKRNLPIRILKAGIKAILIYIAYLVFTLLIQQVYEFIGEYSPLIDVFFAAIAIFAFLTEFFSGTIFKYMLEFSRNLFIIFYCIIALNGGIIDASVQNATIILNLQFFLLMIVLINLIGITRTVLSAINFLYEKSEEKIID